VRLYDDQMAELFRRIPSGTRVELVYQPVKIGQSGSELYLEVHPDVYGWRPDLAEQAREALRVRGLEGAVDAAEVGRTVQAAEGVPVRVGVLHP
jgi:L,D-transpeptidase ErfK/SrfK